MIRQSPSFSLYNSVSEGSTNDIACVHSVAYDFDEANVCIRMEENAKDTDIIECLCLIGTHNALRSRYEDEGKTYEITIFYHGAQYLSLLPIRKPNKSIYLSLSQVTVQEIA